MRSQPRWHTADWRGHAVLVCDHCPFSTFDHSEMLQHARGKHRLVSEGAPRQASPLDGVSFETDRAAEQATIAGLTARDFDSITPTGASGGFIMADVKRVAAKSTTNR